MSEIMIIKDSGPVFEMMKKVSSDLVGRWLRRSHGSWASRREEMQDSRLAESLGQELQSLLPSLRLPR